MEGRVIKLFTTSEVGRVFGVTSDAVRLWERLGRIKAIRTSSGQRVFLAREVERFKIVRAQRKVKGHQPSAMLTGEQQHA